jgi:signal transduction histidine kinase
MTGWLRASPLTADRPIVRRLVLTVAVAMAAVLALSLGFVYWRVSFALDRQLNQDLFAYQDIVRRVVEAGEEPPTDTPGQMFQVYDTTGRLTFSTTSGGPRLVPPSVVRHTTGSRELDVGTLLPPEDGAYRALVERMKSPEGPVVVAAAISRNHHDEALRELLLQLLVAGVLTLASASLVGYRTARAALAPVERYRRAAASHGRDPTGNRLPVPAGRDDELARLGRTLNDLLDSIEASHERERQFLADASHELRTPLTRMRAELEFALLRERGPEELRTALTSIEEQVRRLVDLSNALLDLEELRAHGGVLRERVDLEQLVGRVADRHRPALEAAGRRLEVAVGAGEVCASGRWLEVALDNLLANAVKHGAGTVSVSATPQDGFLQLAVRDEGHGFPEDFAGHAFERFSRAQESRSVPGSGLGLALVEAVARAHGGTAAISGTTVSIRIEDAS